jgi:SdpC family antimicrobial peptide
MPRRFAIPLLAALAAALAACADGGSPAGLTQPVAHAQFSGEDVFRGVVLGDGPVAARLPELWSGYALDDSRWTPAHRAAMDRARQRLIDDVRAVDPTFLARFGAALQSHDPLRVQGAMEESRGVLMSAVQREKGLAGSRVRGDDEAIGTAVAVLLVLTLDGIANEVEVVNLVEAYNVAVNNNAVYDKNFFWPDVDYAYDRLPTGAAMHGRTLQHDEVIEILATRL